MPPETSIPAIARILVVDDQKVNRLFLAEILRKEGYAVAEATSGAEARAQACDEPPDLILLDVVMPGEDGFLTCEHLKRDPRTSEIPILFVSAADDAETKVRGLSSGAVDYISRPFHRDEVLARVRIHLRLAVAERERAAAQAARLLKVAAQAQSDILTPPQSLPEAKFAVRRRAVDEAGGDFYDVFPLGGGIFGYMAADVSGHGLGASYVTPMLKTLVAQNASPWMTPLEFFRVMNTVLHRILRDGRYITACMIRLNRAAGQVETLSAGHPFPLLLPESGPPVSLGAPGNPLGVFEHAVLEPLSFPARAKDRLFLFTDGFLEASGDGLRSRREGEARLVELLDEHRALSLEPLLDALFREMGGNAPTVADDALLLGIEV